MTWQALAGTSTTLCVVLSVSLMLTSTSEATERAKVTYQSRDERLQWALPKKWEAAPSGNTEIKAQLRGKQVYAKVGYETKPNPPIALREYAQHLRDRLLSQLKDAKATAFREAKVRGSEAVFFGARGAMDGKVVVYAVLVIEYQDVFLKASVWAPAAVAKGQRDEFKFALSDVRYSAPSGDGSEVILKSRDGVLELRLPQGWVEKESSDPKEIFAQHPAKRIRLTANRDSKRKFTKGFQTYREQIVKVLLAQIDDAKLSDPMETEVDGRAAVTYVVKGKVDGGEVTHFLTLTEGRENFIKLVIFARTSFATQHAEEIDAVMHAARETNLVPQSTVKRIRD